MESRGTSRRPKTSSKKPKQVSHSKRLEKNNSNQETRVDSFLNTQKDEKWFEELQINEDLQDFEEEETVKHFHYNHEFWIYDNWDKSYYNKSKPPKTPFGHISIKERKHNVRETLDSLEKEIKEVEKIKKTTNEIK
eukprot:gb/GECH01012820.1/.p1 GENE.gb/GECH01012820.1/~~gb/GECH01012820.1/.p1  ORF type:complete len:136 (+),score=34.80 gb/GECH01012820.1/:1-408(+)